MDTLDEESGIFKLSRATGIKMGYYDIKRNGEERNPNCPYFSLLGKVDTALDRDEYYVEDINGKVRRGRITDLYSDRFGNTLYILRNGKGKINSGYDDLGGFRKYHLYDNKEDCKNLAHYASDNWEL